jgi:hypothetical protein
MKPSRCLGLMILNLYVETLSVGLERVDQGMPAPGTSTSQAQICASESL